MECHIILTKLDNSFERFHCLIAQKKMSKFSENQVILIHPEKNLIEQGDIHFNIGHPSSKFDFSLEASDRCLGM